MKHYKDEVTLDDVAYVLCHDLGAPSRALRQYLVMLQHARATNDESAMDKWTARMGAVLDRLDQRLDDVLSVSRELKPTVENHIDPTSIIHELADQLGVQVTIESCKPWRLDTAASRIVLEELLKNVRDHGGGEAIIRATDTGLSCTDKGPGVSCDDRFVFLIFRPVHPADSNNRGIGLARVSRTIRAAGGELQLMCPDEGGTVARIDFHETD